MCLSPSGQPSSSGRIYSPIARPCLPTVFERADRLHRCAIPTYLLAVLRKCRAVITGHGSLLVTEIVPPLLVFYSGAILEGRMMSDLKMLAATGGRKRS